MATDVAVDQLVAQLTARRSNVFRAVERHGVSSVWDRIDVVMSSTRDGHRQTSVTQISGASTTVEIDFPLVVTALAVVEAALPRRSQVVTHRSPHRPGRRGPFDDRFDVYCDDPVRARMAARHPAVMAPFAAGTQDVHPSSVARPCGRLTLSALEAMVADRIEAAGLRRDR